jgi:predicted transcriptional regulator
MMIPSKDYASAMHRIGYLEQSLKDRDREIQQLSERIAGLIRQNDELWDRVQGNGYDNDQASELKRIVAERLAPTAA